MERRKGNYKIVVLKNGTANLMEGHSVIEHYDNPEEARLNLEALNVYDFVVERSDNFVMKLGIEVESKFGKKYSRDELVDMVRGLL